MNENCAHCNKPKPIVLILRDPENSDELLCQDCADTWLDSDEEWGNYKPPKPYKGYFPEGYKPTYIS